jgi:hypothetical protein
MDVIVPPRLVGFDPWSFVNPLFLNPMTSVFALSLVLLAICIPRDRACRYRWLLAVNDVPIQLRSAPPDLIYSDEKKERTYTGQ